MKLLRNCRRAERGRDGPDAFLRGDKGGPSKGGFHIIDYFHIRFYICVMELMICVYE